MFSIVVDGKDVEEVYFGKDGVRRGNGKTAEDRSSTARPSRSRSSADIRKRLKERGAEFVCAPVCGNAKVIKAGKLSSVCSGPEAAFQQGRGR